MRYLYWDKIIAIAALVLICASGKLDAQNVRNGNYNFKDFQSKPYYFGLTLGYNHSNFQIQKSRDFILNDSFRIVSPVGVPGFNVSIVGNLKLGEYFDFRFLPGFSFAQRDIKYTHTSREIPDRTRKIESVFVQLPFHVRYKSVPYRDMRMFVIGGVKYTYDVASNARVRKAQQGSIIRISPHDYAIEVGAGMQFFFPFFIFSPEIKFSQGIGNILIYNNQLDASKVIEKLYSRTFTISIHLEG